MIRLTQIGRNIKISGLAPDKLKELKRRCTYVKQGAAFMSNPAWGIVKLYNERNDMMPLGLLKRNIDLLDTMDELKVYVPAQDLVGPWTNINNNPRLRQYQKDALFNMTMNPLGIIQMPTGSGKTVVAIEFIKMVHMKTLILVPTIDLRKQWQDKLVDVTEIAHVQTYQSIKKREYLQQFDLVIMDECHHCAAKTLYKIGMNVKESALLYGFSATPFNRDDDNLKVEAVLGPVIYRIATSELMSQGFLCPAKIVFHNLTNYENPEFTYAEMYDYYIVNNAERNLLIRELVISSDGPILILVNRIEHGEILQRILKHFDSVFLNGQLKKEDRENNNHPIIIATGIYDEGVDLPHIKHVIIASGGKSAIKAIQKVGRGLRNHPGKDMVYIHDFVDNAKWLLGHSKRRIKILSEDFNIEVQ